MMMLKSALSGKPLKVVEKLGYSPAQYKTALTKLDQKYGGGGEKRLLQRHLDKILQTPELPEDNLKQLEVFSDRLTDIVAKLEDHGYKGELSGISALYTAVQSKIPESMLVLYQQWLHDRGKRDGLSMFANWLAQQVVFKSEAEETRKKGREHRGGSSSSGGKKSSYQSTASKPKACVVAGRQFVYACVSLELEGRVKLCLLYTL